MHHLMSCLTKCEKKPYLRDVRDTLKMMPVAAISREMEVLPGAEERKRQPRGSSTPTTTPMLMNACTAIMAVSPAASRQPWRSGQETAMRMPAKAKAKNSAITHRTSQQPEVLPYDGENEVAFRIGQCS